MREFIHSLRDSLKIKSGEKPFAEWWADYKREEKALEELKCKLRAALGKG
jgi:hypothetical protein